MSASDDSGLVAGGIRCLRAPNPGPMTERGTNSYVITDGDAWAVIDPGPAIESHLAALAALLPAGPGVILVTHSHLDHSAGVPGLAGRTGAPVLAFGASDAGRTPRMAALAAEGGLAGGEGVDAEFRPDRCLADGEAVPVGRRRLRALWTPGHMANRLSFAVEGEGIVLTGDLVMGWSTSLVSPPDGDLDAFMASLDRLAARTEDRLYLPGHGAPVTGPLARVAELAAHRRARHAQIAGALAEGPGTAAEIAARVYTDLDPRLLPAAARNVLAHLLSMEAEGTARAEPPLSAATRFHAA